MLQEAIMTTSERKRQRAGLVTPSSDASPTVSRHFASEGGEVAQEVTEKNACEAQDGQRI